MKINYLKINEFGKLKNKEIKLENNINLIYGKNEAGKTTLLKFISSMFYGLSKNKNGKEISDYEKYTPWKGEDFSGKIKYVLDNKDEYEVFREFSKKNSKIYNKELEDISKNYSIDKTKGNQFFYEQTNIDELLFLSTNLVEQNNVVLNNNSQNILTQKIANILSSGEDNVSYKNVINNLSKKLLEEVGTERSMDRPLNKVQKEYNELKKLIEELNNCIEINNELKIKKQEINEELKNIEKEIQILKEIKIIKENEEKENEKININNNIKNEFIEKINNLKNQINNNEENNNYNNLKNKKINNNLKNNLNIINLIFIPVLIILNILINFINVSKILQNTIIYFTVIYLLINLIIYIIKKINNKKYIKNKNIEKIKIEKEIEVLEENKKNKEKEIELLKSELIKINNIKLEEIKNKYKDNINEKDLMNLFNQNLNKLNYNLEYMNNTYNNKRIELNSINIEEKNNNEKIDKKLECEERIKYLEERLQELHNLESYINIAKETLEEAYDEIKSNITPKFTKDLSLLINNISGGKYKNANFDADRGLIIEKEDGEYINCNNLSIGTIDQLYLSLRLSAMNEISKEKMPIILDEAFAYFDNERLKNILQFINDNYKENQIIIFTCSNREQEILNELKIKYNLVNL